MPPEGDVGGDEKDLFIGMVPRKEGPARSVGFWGLPGRAIIILRDPTLHGRGLAW